HIVKRFNSSQFRQYKYSLQTRGLAPIATVLLHCGGNLQNQFFLPRTRRNLHADRQPFPRLAHRHNRRRSPQEIEPLGITPSIEIFDSLSVDLPVAFAVPERRNRRRRTKQDRIVAHLRKDSCSHNVTLNPGVKESMSRVSWLCRNPARKFLKDRA